MRKTPSLSKAFNHIKNFVFPPPHQTAQTPSVIKAEIIDFRDALFEIRPSKDTKIDDYNKAMQGIKLNKNIVVDNKLYQQLAYMISRLENSPKDLLPNSTKQLKKKPFFGFDAIRLAHHMLNNEPQTEEEVARKCHQFDEAMLGEDAIIEHSIGTFYTKETVKAALFDTIGDFINLDKYALTSSLILQNIRFKDKMSLTEDILPMITNLMNDVETENLCAQHYYINKDILFARIDWRLDVNASENDEVRREKSLKFDALLNNYPVDTLENKL